MRGARCVGDEGVEGKCGARSGYAECISTGEEV